MKRKIISLARSTNVISLPTEWCEKNSLKKGDEVELSENLNSLVISPLERNSIITLNVKNMNPMIKRILGASYKSGYDTMKILFSSNEERDIIEEVIREEFIGFEIISLETDLVVAKSISEPSPLEFENMFRRMILIIISMFENILETMNNIDSNKIALMDKDINKIADYCRRTINKNYLRLVSDKFARNPPLYFIIEQLEKIGDEVRDLACCSDLVKFKDIIKETNVYFNSFYDLFYRFELTKISSFGEDRQILREKIDSLMDEKSTKELIICRSILEKTFDMNGALMAIYL